MYARGNLSNADLSLLRICVAVVRSGGFSAARSELNVSQPTISVKISNLETRLGMRLCERGRAGFRLTTEGQRVFESALSLFQSIDVFNLSIGAMQGRLVGELGIGVADATVTNNELKLNVAIERFKEEAPDAHLNLQVASALELELGLVDNRFHVVVGPLQRRRPELVYAPLLDEEQALYCGWTHPLFDRAPDNIKIEELGEVEYVRRGYLAHWHAPMDTQFRATATTVHMEATLRLILSGTHIGYLPVHQGTTWVENGKLRAILPKLLSYKSPFLIATRRSVRSDLLSCFLKVFRAVHNHPRLH
jgi:LysR family transcriptional regulator, transcriptional activator for bauABCD operon